jgi:hypothetical protein
VDRLEATPNRTLPWPVARPARRSWTRARRRVFVGFVTPAVVVLVLVTVLPLLYLLVLVTGSAITFTDRGAHILKGLPEEWRLFAPDVHEAKAPTP